MTRTLQTRSAATHLVLLALLALSLGACTPAGDEADKEKAPAVVLTAPKGTDDNQWKAYISQEIGKHDDNITEQLYTYYLPVNSDTPDGSDGTSSMYGRQLEQVTNVVLRTVLPGNMLAFGSPDSAKMADLIVAAFAGAKPDALKGSTVVFIGDAADNARVEAAVRAAGAGYVFVEAK